MIEASRWLEWFEMNITGPLTPSRLSRPNTSGVVSFQMIGLSAASRITSRATRPAAVLAQSVG